MAPKIFGLIGSKKAPAESSSSTSKEIKNKKSEKSKASADAAATYDATSKRPSSSLTTGSSKAKTPAPRLPPSTRTAKPKKSSLKRESSGNASSPKTVRIAESRNTTHYFIAHPSNQGVDSSKTTKGAPNKSLLTDKEQKKRDAISKGGMDPELLKKLGFKG